MMEFRVCPDCGGYEMVPIPYEKFGSYGTSDDSQRPCTCRLESEEEEEALKAEKATATLEDGRVFITDNIFAERVVWKEVI